MASININETMLQSLIECDKCRRQITKNNFNKHYLACDGNPIPKKKRKRVNGPGLNWSKGKTFIEIYGDRAQDILKRMSDNSCVKHTPETKKRIADKMLNNQNWLNSITKSGRGKHGYYKGQYFMSTWELAFMVYHIDHKIEFTRNWEKFEYTDLSGAIRYYIPDFIVNGKYVEVKGFSTPTVKHKMESFKFPLTIIGKIEIMPILEYVKNTYGDNFYDVLKD